MSNKKSSSQNQLTSKTRKDEYYEKQNSQNDKHKRIAKTENSNPNKNTEEMMKKYVEDILTTISDSDDWSTECGTEMRKKIRDLIEIELEGKMVRRIEVAEDELVEIKLLCNQKGYMNLLKGNLTLLNTNPETGKELSELGFAQKIITRVKRGDKGHQEFRIRIDKAERYIAEAVAENKYKKEQTTQHYVLTGNYDITTRKLNTSNSNDTLVIASTNQIR